MKNNHLYLFIAALCTIIVFACFSGNKEDRTGIKNNDTLNLLADKLETSLFYNLADKWYPMNIDSLNGGFISEYDYNWSLSKGSQIKSIVQQARHTWSTAFIYEAYPERKQFLEYSAHGFKFLSEKMWDTEFGGFYNSCKNDGSPDLKYGSNKQTYGQAFAIYGISLYYKMSKDPKALELAKKEFIWLEEHAHDPINGGYFDQLNRDGSPILNISKRDKKSRNSPAIGLKDYNSSIHIMESFTQLYLVWPDSLVHKRLEEMFYLIRDTFVHPDGYLYLFFTPEWNLVTDEIMEQRSGGDHYYKNHFTYGHDVETAYLLLETAEVLGIDTVQKTQQIAKKLVDHSLASGWDNTVGGFFDEGKEKNGKITILNNKKSWWGQVEGLNALLIMFEKYPADINDYYGKFIKQWKYIDTYLIDNEYGGWYNNGLDTSPESKYDKKSHVWKTTYHNIRGMVHCIRRLRKL